MSAERNLAAWYGSSSDDSYSNDSEDDSSSSDNDTEHPDTHDGAGTTRATDDDSATAVAAMANAPLHPAASMFAVQRSLHRTKHDLRNRLHSIHYDAEFVTAFASLFYPAGVACFANLRQGAWYLDPALRATSGGGTCCFKSSDGHSNQWSFNPRRLNKHVALAAARRGGVLVVDSTRGGKRLPDALSKTVPIWCAVLNAALARHRQRQPRVSEPAPEPELEPQLGSSEADGSCSEPQADAHMPCGNWDCELHVAPMVPRSEAAQIADRIEGWVDDLEASGSGGSVDLQQLSETLRKPLRPLWFYADSGVSAIPDGYVDTLLRSGPGIAQGLGKPGDAHGPPDGGVAFTPVICLMASETAHPKRGEFVYGQGAADDEEGWSLGLTAAQWWQHQRSILAPVSLEGTLAAAAIARSTPLQKHVPVDAAWASAASEGTAAALSSSASGSSDLWSEICDGEGFGLGVAVGSWEAGAAPQVWEQFENVVNCGALEHPNIADNVATTTTTTTIRSNAADNGTTAIVSSSDDASREIEQRSSRIMSGTRKYLWLDVPAGGKQCGAAKMLSRCLPKALDFAAQSLTLHFENRRQGQGQGNERHGNQIEHSRASSEEMEQDREGLGSCKPDSGCATVHKHKHKRKRLGLLLHCDETEERSVAVAMAVIAHCFARTSEGATTSASSFNGPGGIGRLQLAASTLKTNFSTTQSIPHAETSRVHYGKADDCNERSVPPMDKAYLRGLLCRVQEARPGATTPQRALLQVINRHFLSPHSLQS